MVELEQLNNQLEKLYAEFGKLYHEYLDQAELLTRMEIRLQELRDMINITKNTDDNDLFN